MDQNATFLWQRSYKKFLSVDACPSHPWTKKLLSRVIAPRPKVRQDRYRPTTLTCLIIYIRTLPLSSGSLSSFHLLSSSFSSVTVEGLLASKGESPSCQRFHPHLYPHPHPHPQQQRQTLSHAPLTTATHTSSPVAPSHQPKPIIISTSTPLICPDQCLALSPPAVKNSSKKMRSSAGQLLVRLRPGIICA